MGTWNDEITQWLEPFLARLGHKRRRQMCPLYVSGLLGPGERKSIEPMAARLVPDRYDRLHHFISSGVWDAGPLEEELARQADRMVGGPDAVLVVDDTALPKKGKHSVGVAPQYASVLGKNANCQTLVSLTLARDEVPVAVGLRMFLPESWTANPAHMEHAGVPELWRTARTKPEMALERLIGCRQPECGLEPYLPMPATASLRRSARNSAPASFFGPSAFPGIRRSIRSMCL